MAKNKNSKGKGGKTKVFTINLSWLYIIILIGIGYLLFSRGSSNPQKIEWPEVEQMVSKGDVEEITFVRNDYQGYIKIKPERLSRYADKFGAAGVPKKSPHFFFLVSEKFNPEESFAALGEAYGPVDYKIKNNDRVWGNVLEWIFWPIMMVLLWVWMFRGLGRNMGGGPGMPGGNPFDVGKAKGKLTEKDEKTKVTFKDVAGLYGAKEEVMEIVDFLRNPKKYTALGGKIPKGALLVGPPGTGKTLLAKAVAGEADVPFFSISGSDFVEMFVGVGASRVRDLFRQAKEKAPCIVFIDEIDAVGRARSRNAGFTSNDERENTLNQLLTEMDGFGTNSGVIVLAATNRADILDSALMRAGRFDRQIHVELPELKEREEIFQVHLRGIKVSPDFDIKMMAKHTPGFSGADIANVCNEAALTAARHNHTAVMQEDFLEAVDRIVGGLERKESTIMTPAEKRTTAYHEAGHALVGWLLPYADPVMKVSIIPRGNALGLTWYLPEERKNSSKSVMFDRMCALIAGRVAEEIINGEPSTGALNDLERMTKTAYAMVQYFGMSEKVGAISFYDANGSRGYDITKPYSEKTAELMDKEVKDIVDKVHRRTNEIISSHKDAFVEMAELLLEKEVIFSEDVERILGPKVLPAPDERHSQDEVEKPVEA